MKRLTYKGHVIKLLIKTKDILETLVKEDGWDYENILPERRGDSISSLFFSLILRDVRIYKASRKFRPDILIGSDASITQVGWLIRKPRIIVGEDDFRIVKKHNWLMMPFASCVLAPAVCIMGPFEKKKIAFNGYMKLAYLHPAVFVPDNNVVREIALKSPYCIVRMVKLKAHHDDKIQGLNRALVSELIHKLESKGYHVYLDAEEELPDDLQKNQLRIKKSLMHHLMAFAALIISDSQSISVEAAVLGVPSIRFNDFAGKISVLEELEHKYRLTFGIPGSEEKRLFEKMDELLANPDLKAIFRKRRDLMLEEKINVCDFMVWFLGSYPESLKRIKSQVIDNQFMTNVFT